MEYGKMVDEKDGGVYPSPHHQHARTELGGEKEKKAMIKEAFNSEHQGPNHQKKRKKNLDIEPDIWGMKDREKVGSVAPSLVSFIYLTEGRILENSQIQLSFIWVEEIFEKQWIVQDEA